MAKFETIERVRTAPRGLRIGELNKIAAEVAPAGVALTVERTEKGYNVIADGKVEGTTNKDSRVAGYLVLNTANVIAIRKAA